MANEIYDPVDGYANVFRDRFKQVAEQTFADLAKEAQVDVEANRATCRQIYSTQGLLSGVKTRLGWWRFLCALLWLAFIGAVVFATIKWNDYPPTVWAAAGGGAVVVLLLLFLLVHPQLRKLKQQRDNLAAIIAKLQTEAWQQMEPLNRLYDWDILTRMMSATVPKLEFDPYFTTQRLADLKASYNWDDSFNRARSVIYSHSGLINGNPFVICRTRRMEMGTKTYYGSKTIYWTTRERGSDGKMHSVSHSQTLTASVTKPYPEYFEKTRLIYGNNAAPDLVFHRKQSGMANKEGSISYRWKRHALRNKARDLKDGDYAMMTNEEFEVAFDTSDRNNNQQFALLFTPMAQQSMMKLLQDQEVGFGDDFDFDKLQMINVIVANHVQELDLDLNPAIYKGFDYDKAQADFYEINAGYFRAIYFCFAPLLCVPLYQQLRPRSAIYGTDMPRHSSFWEHEALANFWGQDHFKHPSCVTDCILKTEEHPASDGQTALTVNAYGYRVEKRLTRISKLGGDGRMHSVPVEWDEYLPVMGTGNLYLNEDNTEESGNETQSQRIGHINDVLQKTHSDLYRRHIASHL